jgi:arylamine N-acetyltransferase
MAKFRVYDEMGLLYRKICTTLTGLGHNVKLCGASMKEPDVHLINIVTINNKEYLIDAGNAAPFSAPLPLGLDQDFSIRMGGDEYILRKQNLESQKINKFREGKPVYGYTINQASRNINEFQEIISDSFRQDATFMNNILLTRINGDNFIEIRNLSFISMSEEGSQKSQLDSIGQLVTQIEKFFSIPQSMVLESIKDLKLEADSI